MRYLMIWALFLVVTSCATRDEKDSRYTYSRWILSNPTSQVKPRGGTTTGGKTELADKHDGWLKLKSVKGSKKDLDRSAILAMVGTYKASFEFLETYGFDKGYKLDRPYQSWGTEFVFPIEKKEDFISLQHIMVMYFQHKGETLGPYVMKHWRQDWYYQTRELDTFLGDGIYVKEKLKAQKVKGKWVQKVYQVDDSPRYHAIGQWQHGKKFSKWVSELSSRPLPRRESSVRSDYNVLSTKHTITILQSGWIHEQDSLKINKSKQGEDLLAKEIGINRYQALKNFDITSGKEYWKKTERFWAQVRLIWRGIEKKYDSYTVLPKKDGELMYAKLFELADKSDTLSTSECRNEAQKVISFHTSNLVQTKE